MKLVLTVLCFIILSSLTIFSQSGTNIITLKNGDIYKGQIIKDVPGDFLQLELKDGSIKKFFYSEIEKNEVDESTNSNVTNTSISSSDKSKKLVKLNNGNIIKGMVTDLGEKFKVEMDDGSVVLLNKNEIAGFDVIPLSKSGSLGVGFGIPYGVLGLNGEILINDFLGANLGIGFIDGITWCVGGRLYLAPRQNGFRGMLNLYYGNNGYYSKTVYSGLNAGFGFKWMFGDTKSHGFELEGIYIITSGLYDKEKELEKQGYTIISSGSFKVSVAYRFGF